MVEFLTSGFQKALGWSNLIGLPTPRLSYIPITETSGMVETKSYECFHHIAHGLAYFSIYSRQNVKWGERSYGIQVMGPYSRRNPDVGYRVDNFAAIQWQSFVGFKPKQIVTVDLDCIDDAEARNLYLYYEHGAQILGADKRTADRVAQAILFQPPTHLAKLILKNQIDTNNFDLMVEKLITLKCI